MILEPQWRGLPIRIEHVLEPKPLLVEAQVDEPSGPITVLGDDQFCRPLDPSLRPIHLPTIQGEYDISVMLDCAQRPKIVQPRSGVGSRAIEARELGTALTRLVNDSRCFTARLRDPERLSGPFVPQRSVRPRPPFPRCRQSAQ